MHAPLRKCGGALYWINIIHYNPVENDLFLSMRKDPHLYATTCNVVSLFGLSYVRLATLCKEMTHGHELEWIGDMLYDYVRSPIYLYIKHQPAN